MQAEEITGSRLARYIPSVGWLPNYKRAWLRFDLVAGLTAAAVVIPQAMAYASIAGLPVEVGLYTALTPMLIYALLGTSRPLSVSSTSTISMLTATILLGSVQSNNPYDYIVPAATLALLVGIFLLLAGILRLGFIANFISLPVLTGFKAGIGLVIFVGQLGKITGIPVEKGSILQTVLMVMRDWREINWPTLSIALVTLAILILLPRLTKRVPATLIAVAAGILISVLVNLEAAGVALVGAIPSGLPSLSLPDPSLLGNLWAGALGIALMSFVESIAAGRAFARRGNPPVDATQELIALGVANIGGSFTHAYPAGGGTSQTAVNDQSGAKSQVAEIVTAGTVALTLLFLAPLISLMPEATLGALVLVAAAGLIHVDEFQAILRVRQVEFGWAVIAFTGVVILGTLQGILVAILASMLVIIYMANHPQVYAMGRKPGMDVFRKLSDHPNDETFAGLLLLRSEGLLYYASAPRALESIGHLIREARPSVVVLDCSAIPNIEYTALKQLVEFEERLNQEGIVLWLAALNPDALKVVEISTLGAQLGHERMFFNLEQAVEAYLDRFFDL